MKSNIVLIGFMGTGKTAAGQVLATRLRRKLIEIDAIIEKTTGKSISDIFRDEGEIYFRELEIRAVKKAATGKKQVIVCGGGVVLNTINIDRLRATGVVVNLIASPEIILKRTSRDGSTRPLLSVKQPAERVRELMKIRKPFYDRAADFSVNTSKLSIDAVADKIIDRLENNESFNF
jgi:shikimate kinase